VNNLKRILLSVITLAVVVLLGSNLFASLSEPQISDRLELYQTDLVLRATELDPKDLSESQFASVRQKSPGRKAFQNGAGGIPGGAPVGTDEFGSVSGKAGAAAVD
jgi:hypothetical protein